MKRRVFNFLSAVSLLLAVTLVVLWVVTRDGSRVIVIAHDYMGPAGPGSDEATISAKRGKIVVLADRRSWPDGDPLEPDWAVAIKPRGFVINLRDVGPPAWSCAGISVWTEKGKINRMFLGYFDVYVPIYLPLILSLMLPGYWGFRWWRCRRRHPYACPSCGYDLRASKEKCPECGAVIESKTT